MLLTAKDAIARHMQWRITLQTAIALREALTPQQIDQIQHHRRCLIGQWLDSPATLGVRTHPEFLDLVDKHMSFHREMENIARLIAGGRFEQAAAAMSESALFAIKSRALANAITAFDRSLPIQVFAA